MTTILAATDVNTVDLTTGTFYVLELFPYPQFVIDEEGETKTFDRFESALQEADDCQQGIVLQL